MIQRWEPGSWRGSRIRSIKVPWTQTGKQKHTLHLYKEIFYYQTTAATMCKSGKLMLRYTFKGPPWWYTMIIFVRVDKNIEPKVQWLIMNLVILLCLPDFSWFLSYNRLSLKALKRETSDEHKHQSKMCLESCFKGQQCVIKRVPSHPI